MAKVVRAAISALVDDAHPPESTALGEGGLRRLRLGGVRVLFEVDDENRAIQILTVGRISR